MSNPDLERLRGIKTFPSLVKYLRDDLDWPIESEHFDDLTFDFEPEELGIDLRTSAKIKSISQLRPLTSNQPWGIFFLNFEPKKLPVVVLRRILGQLVIKKRASANRADQQTWRLSDLLFLSNYGENEQRQITFAHFSGNSDSKNLPTLKVLGWDDSDTALHMDYVHSTFRKKLRWPDDKGENLDAWRKTWSSAFTLQHREVIDTSKKLAVKLAGLARKIHKRANSILLIEVESGPLRKLMSGFKESLIHDLTENDFANMYAQTIAYGLLSARITNPKGNNPDELSNQMPITNPFLKELMGTFLSVGGRKRRSCVGIGIDFDELGINEIVDLLDNSNMEAVVRDFDDQNPLEDPVIHFYELFLKEYDPEQKTKRGVFYTPRPVVSFIVKSVDETLKKEFGLEDGLADTATWGEVVNKNKDLKIPKGVLPEDIFVQILDPATGTGTFLVEIIDVIHKTMFEKWKGDGNDEKQIGKLWNDYVPKYLLPRLHGYEILMAPYAIAHMKIGVKLHSTGYEFSSKERTRIYLTNSLEFASDKQGRLTGILPAFAHEATAVNEIKLKQHFTVVVGNPPYSSSISEPTWLMDLLKDWKRGLNEKKIDVNREEWKFLRMCQYFKEVTGVCNIGFIINRDLIDGITKRKMREELGKVFPRRVVVDLNGDVKGNISDQNVFDIEQGVAIVVLSTGSNQPELLFTSLVGKREDKYLALRKKDPIDNALCRLAITPPYFRWIPFSDGNSLEETNEYQSWNPLDEIFCIKSSGIQTKNDAICIGFESDEIYFRAKKIERENKVKLKNEFGLKDGGAWSLDAAQDDLIAFGISKKHIRRILYRPFDWRFTYYTHKSSGFLGRPRFNVMKHMLDRSNIAMIFNRQIVGDRVSHFGVSRDLICHGTFYLGNKGQDYLAPLYRFEDGILGQKEKIKVPNLSDAFIDIFCRILKLKAENNKPELLFHYIYAVLHSPTYRNRYKEYLKIDFPRLPLTSNIDLFYFLERLGSKLVILHLLESNETTSGIISTIGSGEFQVEEVSYDAETVWIDRGRKKGFQGITEEVWSFHIGGYQVCQKWLKDRGPKKGKPGRVLTKEDIDHYQKIIVAISETIRIMAEIDEVIEDHGGWPGAFVTE